VVLGKGTLLLAYHLCRVSARPFLERHRPRGMDTFQGKTIEELREYLRTVATSIAMCRLVVVRVGRRQSTIGVSTILPKNNLALDDDHSPRGSDMFGKRSKLFVHLSLSLC
jgi:hypothetical protein